MPPPIADRLDRIQQSAGVRIVYACESGSRAWGFASGDSDYDVRFVYVHPADWYLSIDLEAQDDTMDPAVEEGPEGEIDLHGWDLRKALGLFRKSNPTLLEWLRSPIVYRETASVMAAWRERIPVYYTRRTAGHAYLGMAKSIARQSLDGDRVTRKAYLYVIRSLLAVRWVERHDTPPPVPLPDLVDACVTSDDLRDAIEALIREKRRGTELGTGPRHPVLHPFIDDEIARLDATPLGTRPPRRDVEPLNAFFRDVLGV